MSMVRCDECDHLIDSDDDPDCFGEFGRAEQTLCRACREKQPLPDDPEVTADIACETALNALDQLMVLAAKEDTAHLVEAERVFVGQILTRAQLVASFLQARHPKLKVISNG